MVTLDRKKLLENEKIVEEINRHLWLESEKVGYDIGFERAADDWIEKYSSEWLKYNKPQAVKRTIRRTKRTTGRKSLK